MKQHWGNLISKVDGISLRERGLIFAAAAFALVALVNALFLDPLLAEKKKQFTEMQQKQEKLRVTQAQIDILSQRKKDVGNSPLRHRIEQARKQLAEGDVYLKSSREHLVAPEKMAELLEQVLQQNGRLQLVDLQTLPVAPLVEKVVVKPGGAGTKPASAVSATPASAVAVPENQLFKHGVKIIVRGSYLDLLQYLTELERLPTQMFWGEAEMKVEKHPEVVLTLTVYTLSLDKTWLKI
jgi:MSHA biogenesis protein MshJ